MAIDDPIEAAKGQIEAGQASPAPQVVANILEGLRAIGIAPAKPVAFLWKKITEQRENNTQYLLDAVIQHVRRLEQNVKALYEQHQEFVEIALPNLTLEAVARAQQTSSEERIDRLGLVVVHSVLRGPTFADGQPEEMLRVSVELSALDLDVLAQIYAVQAVELRRHNFLPEQNLANSSWKQLQASNPLFQSSEVYSICAKLQSLGLLTQVERIPTMLGLTSIPYAVLRNGATYLELVEKSHTATIIS
jgi:hypothetical protein